MNFSNLFKEAKKEIVIIGVLPLEEFLIENASLLAELVIKNSSFKITIIHESESMLFNRSLYLDSRNSKKRISFKELKNKISRVQRLAKSFMFKDSDDIYKRIIEEENRFMLLQLNLWQPMQIIKLDGEIYSCPLLMEISSIADYKQLKDDLEIQDINRYIEYVINENKGGIYQSSNDDEMIEMYDREDMPRGIFPRKAFYNTDFQRFSVWVFIFNRKGQLLLHQRSTEAKDNRGLWDKSAGGHVDVKDRSSADTAERELIEEMYLQDAEYSKYVTHDRKNFVNLGEWLPAKRENEQVFNLFKRLDHADYGYFFIRPSVKRTSKRKLYKSKNSSEFIVRETKFISDIYLFVAPEDELKNEGSLESLKSSAAAAHRLIEVRTLLDEIEDAKVQEKETEIYTDDLLYIADEFKETLLSFSDQIQQVF